MFDIQIRRLAHVPDGSYVIVSGIKTLEEATRLRKLNGDIVVHHRTNKTVYSKEWLIFPDENETFAKRCIEFDHGKNI